MNLDEYFFKCLVHPCEYICKTKYVYLLTEANAIEKPIRYRELFKNISLPQYKLNNDLNEYYKHRNHNCYAILL